MPVPINYLAVVAAAVASMVMGFLWYGVLFGKVWMRSVGIDPNDIARVEQMRKGAGASYVYAFISALVMAYVLVHIIAFASSYTNATGVGAGLAAAFWSWLGFVATTKLVTKTFEQKSWSYFFVNSGYHLAELLVMGAILAVWK